MFVSVPPVHLVLARPAPVPGWVVRRDVDQQVGHVRCRHRTLTRGLAKVPGSSVEGHGGEEDEYDGEDEWGVAMHLPHTTVVLPAPTSLGAVHHVQDVKADPVQLGELHLEDLLPVEVVEGEVVCPAGRARPTLLTNIESITCIRIFVKAVENRICKGKEVICYRCQVALVRQRLCETAATKAFRPETMVADNVGVSGLHNLHLVLAGQN